MRKKKMLVFISHIKDEKVIALKLQEIIKTHFENIVDVFVSSDRKSIKAGKDWLPQIRNSLKGCSLEIVLCSKTSVDSRWINFEAGAGWILGIRVIPLCFNGMDKGKLPSPFSSVQAKNLDDTEDFQDVLDSISEIFGISVKEYPKFEWKPLIDSIVTKSPSIKISKFVSEFWNIVQEYHTSPLEDLLEDRYTLYRLKKSSFQDLMELVDTSSEYGLGKNDLVVVEKFMDSDGGIYMNPWTFAEVVISKRFRNELEKQTN